MKQVILSEHALFQMQERGIDREIIIGVIARPDKVYTQISGRIQVVRRIIRSGKTYCIIAIYENLPRHYRVITIFITSKIRKYLRP